MEDNEFWIKVWLLVTLVLMTTISSCTVTESVRTNKIADAIKAGNNPIAVSCALNPPGESEARKYALCSEALKK